MATVIQGATNLAQQRFSSELVPSSRGSGGHLVNVPDHVVAALGGRGRTPINATFNGIPYRGSIVRMGGTFCLGVTKAIIAEAGLEVGQAVDIVVELDSEPREVEVPLDLAEALEHDPGVKQAWDALSFTQRKELAASILGARKAETRRRHLDQTLDLLRSKAPP